MKIKYKGRHIRINLIFGILWIIFFILAVFVKDDPHWVDYGYLLMSVLYLGLYFYQRANQYLIIENGFIKYNRPFASQFDLSTIPGGSEARPAEDHGFMFSRAFNDLDGHIWEIFYMDMSAMPENEK